MCDVDKCGFIGNIKHVIRISGTKIRNLRKSKDLTIKELADEIGLSSSAIGMYERGMRSPDLETIIILSRFFAVDMEYFFEGINNLFEKERKADSNSDKVFSSRRIENTLITEKALKRANGNCEFCQNRAPFICSNGIPYLETYLIKKKAVEGNISIDDIAAVCPNCYKKLEILQLPGDIMFLQQQIRQKNLKIYRE